MIDNTGFKQFLELVPEMRELISDFYSSRYTSLLQYLDGLKPSLLLDIHLHDHVDSLFGQIRSKALVQYFSPYSSVDMKLMAEAFNTGEHNSEMCRRPL